MRTSYQACNRRSWKYWTIFVWHYVAKACRRKCSRLSHADLIHTSELFDLNSPAYSDPHQMKKYPGPCVYKYSRQLKNPPTSFIWPVIIFLCILFLLTNSWKGGSNNQLKLSKHGKLKLQQPYRAVLRCTDWMCRCSEMLPLRILSLEEYTSSVTSYIKNVLMTWWSQ